MIMCERAPFVQKQLILIFSLLLIVLTTFIAVHFHFTHQVSRREIVNVGIIIEDSSVGAYNDLAGFIDTLPIFTKYDFYLKYDDAKDVYSNSTWIAFLTSKGKIIPTLGWTQLHDHAWRRNLVDEVFEKHKNATGSYPRGFADFQPDTYIANYARQTYNITFIGMQIFEQWMIDWMTSLGNWQCPYYARENNVLLPSEKGKGIVMLPHLTWDWICRNTKNHQWSSHPEGLYTVSNNENEMLDYLKSLCRKTVENMEPFGFFVTMFENVCSHAYNNYYRSWYEWLLSQDFDYMTCDEIADYLNENFDETPTYTIEYTPSEITGETRSIEWFFNKDYRIARLSNNYVCNFIDYTKNQTYDQYLDSIGSISTSSSPSKANCIWYSVYYTIDDWRGAPNGSQETVKKGQFFDKNLEKFSSLWVED